MKVMRFIPAVALVVAAAAQTSAITLTFDDVSGYPGLLEYREYGIAFDFGFSAVDHTGSSWGPPRSGNNVLVWNTGFGDASWIMFKKYSGPPDPPQVLNAYSVSGYFSTERGTVLAMIGYHNSTEDPPLASVMIGGSEEAWNNQYAKIDSPGLINIVVFRPLTDGALLHFCADDISVEFVPEPSSLLAFGASVFGLAGAWRRSRRSPRWYAD